MGLFNFGKPKDEILQEKINKLQSTIDKKRNELDEIKRQIKIGKDTIYIDVQRNRILAYQEYH